MSEERPNHWAIAGRVVGSKKPNNTILYKNGWSVNIFTTEYCECWKYIQIEVDWRLDMLPELMFTMHRICLWFMSYSLRKNSYIVCAYSLSYLPICLPLAISQGIYRPLNMPHGHVFCKRKLCMYFEIFLLISSNISYFHNKKKIVLCDRLM